MYKKLSLNIIIIFSSINIINAQAALDTLHYADEKHFTNIRQLTFGGDNAEAYWSFDGKQIIFQRTNSKESIVCDRMFVGNIPTNAPGIARHSK